jgi:hypothetical protein
MKTFQNNIIINNNNLIIFNGYIFAQVNITNPTRWLVKFDVLS